MSWNEVSTYSGQKNKKYHMKEQLEWQNWRNLIIEWVKTKDWMNVKTIMNCKWAILARIQSIYQW